MFKPVLLSYGLLLASTMGIGEAIICYKCDATTLEACAMSLDETDLPIEDCQTSIQCVMSIVDTVTYRGCATNTPMTGATYYKTCVENLCNKGVYPPGRLKCHHCADSVCWQQPAYRPRPCRWHHEVDQCYTEVVDTNTTFRGCSSDTNHTVRSDTNVEYCDINGCNDKAAVRTLQCAQCDSIDVRGCKMDLFAVNANLCNITQYEICEMNVLFTESNSCFTYHNLDRVVRGCTPTMPAEVAADMTHVQQCSDLDFCNSGCLTQQRCVACDSAMSETCRSDPSSLAITTCGSAEASSCYACEYANWHVQRGCGSTPPIAELPDRNRCYECDGAEEDKCNATPFTRCYKCSTTVTSSCANWERPSYDVDIEECSDPGAACIIAAFPDGVTLRGCKSDMLFCNETQATCDSCSGSFCNSGKYPRDTLLCHQCDRCGTLLDDALPCVPHQAVSDAENEGCFEFFTTQTGMVRGCRSNAAQYFQCIYQNSDIIAPGCHVCHSDGCNNTPASATPILQCFICDSTDYGCQEDQLLIAQPRLQPCQSSVPFGYNESCFVTQYLNGTTRRGCTLDNLRKPFGALQTWGETTTYCSQHLGCNSLTTVSQFCVRCEVDLVAGVDVNDCATKAFGMKPVLCASNSHGCYVSMEGALLKRGCTSDLDSSDYENCKRSPTCHTCREQQCNVSYRETVNIFSHGYGKFIVPF